MGMRGETLTDKEERLKSFMTMVGLAWYGGTGFREIKAKGKPVDLIGMHACREFETYLRDYHDMDHHSQSLKEGLPILEEEDR